MSRGCGIIRDRAWHNGFPFAEASLDEGVVQPEPGRPMPWRRMLLRGEATIASIGKLGGVQAVGGGLVLTDQQMTVPADVGRNGVLIRRHGVVCVPQYGRFDARSLGNNKREGQPPTRRRACRVEGESHGRFGRRPDDSALTLNAFAGDNGYKIVYDGGSLPNGKAGTDMKLYILSPYSCLS